MTDATAQLRAFRIERAAPLAGRLAVAGDRLAAHLALAAAALAEGVSRIEGLAATRETAASLSVLEALGVGVAGSGVLADIHGLGMRGLLAPAGPVDLGDSDLTAALGLGLAGILPMQTHWTVSEGRDIDGLVGLLRDAGAGIDRDGAALAIAGPRVPAPLEHRPGSEAEALLALLVAFATPGASSLLLAPDRAEALAGPLRAFGAEIGLAGENGETRLSVTGLKRLDACRFAVAGDPQHAAWAALAALIVPKSDITIENVLVSPARTGLIDALLEMGGNIDFANQREEAGEHVADLKVRSAFLRGIDASQRDLDAAGLAALAIAGAYARGETRLPPSADLQTLIALLQAMGVSVTAGEDAIVVAGSRNLRGGGELRLRDASLVQPLAILALAADRPVTLILSQDAGPLPPLFEGLARLGARFDPIAEPTP
jgi:3-phosphoshikimate 1-carboxyvinyltransferase